MSELSSFQFGFLLLTAFSVTIVSCFDSSVVLSWKQLDYKFKSAEDRESAIESREFIPENNAPSGIKIYSNRIFLSVPRQRLGVPSTLNFIRLDDSEKGNGGLSLAGPPLEPYPSWEMQEIKNCSALQSVQSMEIDEFGRLWVIDSGRLNTSSDNPKHHQNVCPAKLIIIDLGKDDIVAKHEFPSDVVSPTTNFLNDIAVGCDDDDKDNQNQKRCWAYISDSGDAKIVIYNLEADRSWFVTHSTSMDFDPEATTVQILGQKYSFNARIDGIALSSKDLNHDRIFYAPLSSFEIYSAPTSFLKSAKNGASLNDEDVTVLKSNRSSQSDGMMMDSEGRLIFGVLQNNSVAYINITTNPNELGGKEISLVENDKELQWPASLAFDERGYLYTLSTRAHAFNTNSLNWNETNFRIVKTFLGSRSYVYSSADDKQTDNRKISEVFDKKPESKSEVILDKDVAPPLLNFGNNKVDDKIVGATFALKPESDAILNDKDSFSEPESESEKLLSSLWSRARQVHHNPPTLLNILQGNPTSANNDFFDNPFLNSNRDTNGLLLQANF